MIGPAHVLGRRSRAHAAAVRAATEALLNCYMREYGGWHVVPAGEVPDLAQPGDTHLAVLPIAELHSTLLAGVRYLSPTSRHRFRLPAQLAVDGGEPRVASLATVAELLVRPLGACAGATGADPAALLARIDASVGAVATFLAAREDEVDALWSAAPLSFLDSEQALLLGHMLHPTPKSRSEMSDAALRAFSPETAARFQLHWLAVQAGLVEHDSATGTPAPRLAESLLRDDPAVDEAALDAALAGLGERVLIPAHPWELAHLREHDAVVGALLADGAIVDLGPLGRPVAATTSLRTVCHPDWPW
ncbi:MAG: IucA/IucC family protein, partial [Solirubrobacteraceae bacterium]|nr:IucA/IucC family protein [Solirubrobacteraceae bacterium]